MGRGLAAELGGAVTRATSSVASAIDFARPLTGGERAAAGHIATVVLPLGPYRNLTTMTAALFALHPGAVVLNHAAERVFASRYDPFGDLSPERWAAFKAMALRLCEGGRRGDFGGNVLRSHAFATGPLAGLYRARFGRRMAKPGARTLFWKDSMRFQRRFMKERPSIDAFMAARPDAVFLFPVRNPMDCARSNLATGHWRHLAPKDGRSFEVVLPRILEALAWFRLRERADPERFMSFTEAELGPDLLDRLERFARLPASAQWRDDAPGAIEVASRDAHPPGHRALCARLVADLFAGDPEMRARLEGFL